MALTLDNTGVLQSGEDGEVTVTFTGNVAILQMKCGENRLNPSFIRKMLAALDEVESNTDCKALITTGTGKYYSNGLDVNWMRDALPLNQNFTKEFRERLAVMQTRMLTFPMPTVAAINGHVFAGGVILLSLTHDYSLMNSSRGYFCVNEIHLRLRLRPMSMLLLREKVRDPQFFSEIVFNGKRLTAKEAKRMGVISAACEGEKLLEEALKVANEAAGVTGLDRATLQTLKSDAYREILRVKDYTSYEDLDAAKL